MTAPMGKPEELAGAAPAGPTASNSSSGGPSIRLSPDTSTSAKSTSFVRLAACGDNHKPGPADIYTQSEQGQCEAVTISGDMRMNPTCWKAAMPVRCEI